MPPRARKPKLQTGPVQASFVENSHGRHSDDFYRTPPEVTQALCDELVLRGITPRTVLDVGCGDGAIGQVIRQKWPRVDMHGIEVDPARYRIAGGNEHQRSPYNSVWRANFFDEWVPGGSFGFLPEVAWDLIVFNSWFRQALAVLRKAIHIARPGGHVASLLISQWDQETVHDDERGRFLDSLRRPDGSEGYGQLKFKGRVDCRGNGKTDRVGYKWLIWGPGFEGQFVRVPRSPVATHEQLGLFGKGSTS